MIGNILKKGHFSPYRESSEKKIPIFHDFFLFFFWGEKNVGKCQKTPFTPIFTPQGEKTWMISSGVMADFSPNGVFQNGKYFKKRPFFLLRGKFKEKSFYFSYFWYSPLGKIRSLYRISHLCELLKLYSPEQQNSVFPLSCFWNLVISNYFQKKVSFFPRWGNF